MSSFKVAKFTTLIIVINVKVLQKAWQNHPVYLETSFNILLTELFGVKILEKRVFFVKGPKFCIKNQ
jgi:hypothetical protein